MASCARQSAVDPAQSIGQPRPKRQEITHRLRSVEVKRLHRCNLAVQQMVGIEPEAPGSTPGKAIERTMYPGQGHALNACVVRSIEVGPASVGVAEHYGRTWTIRH